MLCALHYKRHLSRLPAQQRQVGIPLRYFSEDKSPTTSEHLYVAPQLMWIGKLLFDFFFFLEAVKELFSKAAGERNFPGKCWGCHIWAHVEFKLICWGKFVSFCVALANQINKKWVKVFQRMMKVRLSERRASRLKPSCDVWTLYAYLAYPLQI